MDYTTDPCFPEIVWQRCFILPEILQLRKFVNTVNKHLLLKMPFMIRFYQLCNPTLCTCLILLVSIEKIV